MLNLTDPVSHSLASQNPAMQFGNALSSPPISSFPGLNPAVTLGSPVPGANLNAGLGGIPGLPVIPGIPSIPGLAVSTAGSATNPHGLFGNNANILTSTSQQETQSNNSVFSGIGINSFTSAGSNVLQNHVNPLNTIPGLNIGIAAQPAQNLNPAIGLNSLMAQNNNNANNEVGKQNNSNGSAAAATANNNMQNYGQLAQMQMQVHNQSTATAQSNEGDTANPGFPAIYGHF